MSSDPNTPELDADNFPVKSETGESQTGHELEKAEEDVNPEDENNILRRARHELPAPPVRAGKHDKDPEIMRLSKAWALAARELGMNITEALQRTRASIRAWKKLDPEFNAAWDEASVGYKDMLEAEAFRRGALGWSPKKGITSYSDPLLKMMITAEKPEKYGDKTSGAIIQVNVGDVSALHQNATSKDQDVIDVEPEEILKELES